ncbi:Longitudinals lacking protein-like [Orchesella cincta]|uniref:Longitudinals lacking protein-like n=1 Tax=Orchesella cincta TaxID=48709 RepID=A0A1D2N1Y5_ORCCI|nr:Longitudinals lacking protein-like [Orchesella cincta]
MAAAHQQFSLRWNNYSQHIVTALEELRVDDELTDVTLSCEGQRVKAHKLLLSACSVFFKDTFKENPCKHPIIILKGVSFADLQAVIQFMYNGQVNVTQERLPSFLQTAEILQIKGLTDSANSEKEETPVVTKKRPQTFPAQASTTVDSVRQDSDSRPPTPKRKRVIGAVPSAQSSELTGTPSVISASGNTGGGGSSHSTSNQSNPPPPPLIAHNSENSRDGLPIKYEEQEQDLDDSHYDRNTLSEDNDNSFQDNGNDEIGVEQNSLAALWAQTTGLLGTAVRGGAFDDQDSVDAKYQMMNSLIDSGGEEYNTQAGYVCPICNHVSRSAGGRSNHMQTHRDPKICPICHQTFLRRDNLNRHIREKHQGQRRRP